MRQWIMGFQRALSVRGEESENRKNLRTSLMEGVPSNIIAVLLGGPLQTVYLTYLGFSALHIGLVLAIPPLALLVQVPVAYAMQKWHNRRLYMTFLGVFHRILWVGTGLIPLTFTEDSWIPVYIALWLLSMLSAQACGVIWTSIMADMVPPSLRGKYFGIRNTVHWFVICATLLIGGQIMEWLPGPRGFVVLFSASAACIVWNWWFLKRYPNPPFEPSADSRSFKLLKRPFADKRFLSATMFISFFVLVQNIAVPLFAYVMLEVIHLGTFDVTLITMLQNLLMMFSYYYWGVLNGKYSTNALLLWTFPIISVSCVAFLGMSILPAMLVLIAAHALLGIGLAGYNLLVFNFLIGDTPKSDRPMYVAVFSFCTGIAGFIGPIGGGWLYDAAKTGPEWIRTYGITAIVGAAMLVLALGLAPFVFRARKAPA